jgi:hypothetical protein
MNEFFEAPIASVRVALEVDGLPDSTYVVVNPIYPKDSPKEAILWAAEQLVNSLARDSLYRVYERAEAKKTPVGTSN